ncbi:MAG: translation initiation factor eIF-1A [Candidatus Pacearchaeota archaeon]
MEEEIERKLVLPKENQVIGIVEKRLGGNKVQVECFDGYTRVCRIPGRFKRTLWIRPKDIVLVEKLEFEENEKGEVIFKYSPAEVEKLKKMGLFKPEL